MIIIKIWLICSAICIFTMFISSRAVTARLKREYIVVKGQFKCSFSEIICAYLCAFIPVCNVVCILNSLLAQSKIVEAAVKKYKLKPKVKE